MSRIYLKENVYEKSKERIRYLMHEFDHFIVSVSGGKDSRVIFELAMEVAKEENKLPLNVLFLDQEAEYQATIDEIKTIMYHEDVKPYWLQIPFKIFNATSTRTEWLQCWEEGEKWMREKDPIAIKENVYGTDRFEPLLQAFADHFQKENGGTVCDITGVRTQESMSRFAGLTQSITYKDITWGKKNLSNDKCFTFHPIYDWSYTDIWKAINDNDWTYNQVYNWQYQYGVPVNQMRVSNLHHETSVHALFMLQEFEPDTHNKLTQRIDGMDTAAKLGKDDFFIKELPFMFKDWKEYRDYLLENLIEEDKQEIFRRQFDSTEKKYLVAVPGEILYRAHINSIMANDWHGTKLGNARHGWNFRLRDYERKIKEDEMARAKMELNERQE